MIARTYAHRTAVSIEQSRAQIEKLLAAHGATQFLVGTNTEQGRAIVAFVVQGAKFRLQIELTRAEALRTQYMKQSGHPFRNYSENRKREFLAKMCEQRDRERWRAVWLVCKAKLELVRLGLSTVEQEFLAHLVLPSGETVHQAIPEIVRRGWADTATPQLGTGD